MRAQFAFGVLQTLADLLSGGFAATRYIFDEISEPAQTAARQRLLPFIELMKFGSFDDLDIEPDIVFSNELLDAFPVHRVTVVDGTLREYYVTLDSNEQFAWMIGPPSVPELAEHLNQNDIRLREGQVVEVNLDMEAWLAKAATKLKQGYVITVDYGAEAADLYNSGEREQGTLRSFRRHAFVDDVLVSPGESDLTSTINWTAIRAAGEKLGLEAVAFARQDKFLLEAGLLDQLAVQSQNTGQAERIRLSTAAREMILPNGMAASFQVLVQKKT